MPKYTTISQSEYDRMSDLAIKNQPIRKQVALRDLEVASDSVLKYQGRFIGMSSQAFKDICKIVGLPVQFNNTFKENFGEKARQQLINRLKVATAGKGNTSVSLVLSPETKTIIGARKDSSDLISNKTFLDNTTSLIDQYGLEVNSFSTNSEGGVVINASSPTNHWGLKGLKDEEFFGGVTFTNTLKNGFEVSPYIHRLICANGMIGKSFEETMKLGSFDNPNKSAEFFSQLNQMAERGFRPHLFEEKVRKAMETPSSLAEMGEAYELIRGLSGADYKDLESWIPYQGTRKRFHDAGIDTIPMNPEQRKGAKTGTSIWDVINGITHFATHDNGFKLDDYDRRRMQVEAGKLLTKKTYDIHNLVPSPF